MTKLATLLKNGRRELGINMSEVGRRLDINHSLISRFESSDRIPTKPQIDSLINLYKLNQREVEIEWHSQRIVDNILKTSFPIDILMKCSEKLKI